MSLVKRAVYIGRFSICHKGHLAVMLDALSKYDELIIIIGSAEQARSIKDPWSAPERESVIRQALYAEGQRDVGSKVHIFHAHDHPYNDQLWLKEINSFIDPFLLTGPVTLVGADKDESTYYLKYFSHLKRDLTKLDDSALAKLNATDIRNAYFGGTDAKWAYPFALEQCLPQASIDFLNRFKLSPAYQTLREEQAYIKKYKEQWAVAPYPPTFLTVDSVVTQAGHVILIKRKAAPGKGLWALPGGFLDQHERMLDAAIRELREETKLKVPVPVLRGSVKKKELYDKPDRSLRGRTVTVAYHFELAETGELPPIKGGDDAAAAEWVSLSKLEGMRSQFFEDHYSIVTDMIGG